MPWIPLKDQTPPEGECLIVIDAPPNKRIRIANYQDFVFWVRDGGASQWQITHWQPLPEYPEAG